MPAKTTAKGFYGQKALTTAFFVIISNHLIKESAGYSKGAESRQQKQTKLHFQQIIDILTF